MKTPLAREWGANNGGSFSSGWVDEAQQSNRSERPYPVCNPSGANPRDVQTWASEPLKEKHYAAFPTALVRFCLRAGTSLRGYCPTCGAPWCRIVETGGGTIGKGSWFQGCNVEESGRNRSPFKDAVGPSDSDYYTKTLGWKPTCRCPEQEPRPGLVLDPFSGSARTGLTAIRMGLDYVGVELSPEYVEMSRKLLKQDAPLFAGGVE